MKVSIVIPVYYNEDTLDSLYKDIKENYIDKIDYDYEIVMVNDGSKDRSYEMMSELAATDSNIRIFSLSRNFGSHAACLCGLTNSTGDCAVIKTADLQEPSELLFDMVDSWRTGNNVVLACRKDRMEGRGQVFFANLYYWLVQKTSLPTMPNKGFDVYLLDRRVIDFISSYNEKNSAITGQILWSGFRTGLVFYKRQSRQVGTSKWTLRKKIRLVKDTLFSFSVLPIQVLEYVGVISLFGGIIWAAVVFIAKLRGNIPVSGYTTLLIFNLLSFGITMVSMGILGEYLWRTFDSSRRRPPYIIEDMGKVDKSKE